jgi:hypothetical protein
MYTLPVLYTLEDPSFGPELRRLLSDGPPEGERLALALELVRSGASLTRAREVVTREIRRAKRLAGTLAPGAPQDALVNVAEFIAGRCGAES